jgi:hypothetical protein
MKKEILELHVNNEFQGYMDGVEYMLKQINKRFYISLNLKQLSILKQKLLSLSISDLRTLRASLNAGFNKNSNFTPLGIFLNVLFSGCFTILASYCITSINFGTNMYIQFLGGGFKTKGDTLSLQLHKLLQQDFENKSIVEVFQKVFFDNLGSYFQLFGFFLVAVFIYIIFYYFKANRISKLKFILDEALEEKLKVEENKTAYTYRRKNKK